MRKASLVFLACAMVLVTPHHAEAQVQQPLRTLCMSAAQDYCISILTWTYVDGSPSSAGSLSFDFDLFGSAVPVGPLTLALYVSGSPYAGDFIDQVERTGPGGATFSDGTNASLGATGQDPMAADFFLANLGLFGNDFVACSTGGRTEGNPCYEVPEPGTLPLVLTAVLGLALVGWRRQTGPDAGESQAA